MLLIGSMSFLLTGGVLCLDVCLYVDLGQRSVSMDLQNMNFLQIQDPVESLGWGTDDCSNGWCPRKVPCDLQ